MPTILDLGTPPHASFTFVPNPLLPAAGTGTIEETRSYAEAVQHIRLQLTSVVISITDALAYGSALLGYLPDKNLIFLGGESNLTWIKDGTGIVTGELPKIAFGTAAASNATLSATMINLINGGAGGTAVASGLTGTHVMHSNDNVTAIPYVGIADGPTTGLYANAAVNPTGDGTLTISGTIDLYFIDLGNVVS